MARVLFLFLFLTYYWYFYASGFTSAGKPSQGSPSPAPSHQFKFESKNSKHFKFSVNGKSVWEHTLTVDRFKFHRGKIVEIDPCHDVRDDVLVPATGEALYDYLKLNPEIKNFSNFKENSQFAVQRGTVFYFKCKRGRIDRLQICPSGTTLVSNACQNVDSCTGKADGTLLPHPSRANLYIACEGEKEKISKCPDQTIFYHDRCEPVDNLTHYCKAFPNASFIYDDESRIECREGKLVFVRCGPGTKFINSGDSCEPAICLGQPDGTKIPLPERHAFPFNFIPGYMECLNDKIGKTVECPQTWDESLTRGDDLTFLPMVFDGQKCSVPSFCENVFSNDPDVVVPVHDFTKHVKNWDLSKILDRGSGYACENRVRKRRNLEPGRLISKRFKVEPACSPPVKLPIYGSPNSFYDCAGQKTTDCPPSTFFDGSTCAPRPKHAFEYKNVPLFQFDSLNFESWITPWEYARDPVPSCREPESAYVELYNVCSHPDCTDYAFVTQIPDMKVLLPRRAKCKFYEDERKLKKEPADFEYDFWSQKSGEGEPCRPGQKIQTGNFIWDSTIFATCDLGQPFVFCPSPRSREIIPISDKYYACRPPDEKSYEFGEASWTPFETNEIKRILPTVWDNSPKYVQLNRSKPRESIPDYGLDVPEKERINLLVGQPVKIEPRYRVTHPPNVAFVYDKNQGMDALTSTLDRGFLLKVKAFTNKPLAFPKYTPVPLVESFKTV